MNTVAGYRQHLKEKLDSCFTRKDDKEPGKRFARRGVTREIFEKERLFKLLQLLIHDRKAADPNFVVDKIRGSVGSPCYNNVLAILLYSRCKDETLEEFVDYLLSETSSDPVSDSELPITLDAACKAFGKDDGSKFWEDQYLFSPIVLKEGDEVTYTGHRMSCPAPFVEERKFIGQGAYAIVYKVRIEKGHLMNEQGANDNDYAMKTYTGYCADAKRSFEGEGTTIKQFIQCAKSHENIAITKAGLEWGDSYSLFFDLAKGNLWEHFIENAVPTSTLEDKGKIFSQTIGLAGALAYLHGELYLPETNEKLQCYHLDLKPQNILIYQTNGKEVWKISDFGISQIKRISPKKNESEHHISFLDNIFKSKKSREDPSSGVDNSRYGGTYSAPEAKEKSGTVTRKSDVWSLACIITLVLTFILKQSSGIEEFQKVRASDRSHDRFYDSKALKAGSENKKILHPSVSNWLDTLKREASKRSKSELKITEKTADLLNGSMFLLDQDKRISAKDVEQRLIVLKSLFTEDRNVPAPTEQDEITPATVKHQKSSLRRLWGNATKRLSHLNHREESRDSNVTGPWAFDIPLRSKRCKFSTHGKYICVASDLEMAIKPISQFRDGQRSDRTFQLPQWEDFCVGSKYLCVAVLSEYFHILYFSLSTEDDMDRPYLCKKIKRRIRKAAISLDDKITAFVLEDFRNGKKKLSLALYNTRDLLEMSTSSMASSDTATSEVLPWNNIIRESQDSAIPDGVQLVDLKFSSNGNVIMGVTKPHVQRQGLGMQYDVMTWNVTSGQRLPTFISSPKGYDGLEKSWAVEAFAVSSNQPSFANISKRKIRWGDYDPPRYKSESTTISHELQEVLITEDEDELVLVARPSDKYRSDAFRVRMSDIQGLQNLGPAWPISSHEYNQSTDCCCLLESDDKLAIMVATIDLRNKRGRLFERSWERS